MRRMLLLMAATLACSACGGGSWDAIVEARDDPDQGTTKRFPGPCKSHFEHVAGTTTDLGYEIVTQDQGPDGGGQIVAKGRAWLGAWLTNGPATQSCEIRVYIKGGGDIGVDREAKFFAAYGAGG